VAEYKSRRERRHAQGGKVGEKKAPAIALIIGLGKKPKKKDGGCVEGGMARSHLGKRARGGSTGEPRKTKQLDAREAALSSDGVDKVASGSHRDEREVPEEKREDAAIDKVDDFYLKTNSGKVDPKQMYLARPSKFGADDDYRRAEGGGVPKPKFEVDDTSSQDKGNLVAPRRDSENKYENDSEKRARGGRLTAHQRQVMPSSAFALPGKGEGPGGKGAGSYPINDPNHARNALARVAQHGTSEEKAKVRAAVHRRYPGIGK